MLLSVTALSVTVGLVAVCRVKFAGETRDAVAHLYPTDEEARITCAIVDAAARVRDLNFKYLSEGKGAAVTARFWVTVKLPYQVR